jgi:hypothetical protein
MRRENRKSRTAVWIGLASLSAVLTLTAPAKAQQQPNIPITAERSGLIGRYVPYMKTNMPPDKYRDNFYGTRYGDFPTSGHYNRCRGGGLMGLALDPGCTKCANPYFPGAPGQPSGDPEHCQPWARNSFTRVVQGFTHPFKPIGHYYQSGCYVPVYDLDPLIPGPGPDLWPFYINGHGG